VVRGDDEHRRGRPPPRRGVRGARCCSRGCALLAAHRGPAGRDDASAGARDALVAYALALAVPLH
jgi:hypothetical protein